MKHTLAFFSLCVSFALRAALRQLWGRGDNAKNLEYRVCEIDVQKLPAHFSRKRLWNAFAMTNYKPKAFTDSGCIPLQDKESDTTAKDAYLDCWISAAE